MFGDISLFCRGLALLGVVLEGSVLCYLLAPVCVWVCVFVCMRVFVFVCVTNVRIVKSITFVCLLFESRVFIEN